MPTPRNTSTITARLLLKDIERMNNIVSLKKYRSRNAFMKKAIAAFLDSFDAQQPAKTPVQ